MREEARKAAKMRAEKAEEEVQELMNKARQLEIELGMCVLSSCSQKTSLSFLFLLWCTYVLHLTKMSVMVVFIFSICDVRASVPGHRIMPPPPPTMQLRVVTKG